MTTLMMTRTGALAAMILEAKEASGMGYREMATRARDQGHRISWQQLNSYVLGNVVSVPKSHMVKAIAAAIGRPEEDVMAAAIDEFLGWRPHQYEPDDGSSRNIHLPPGTTPEQARAIQQMVDAWIRPTDTTDQ